MGNRDITNSDDIIDVRDVIERFEELEGNRKPWRAGWNMPGYMPDSEPSSFETFDDAKAALIEDIKRFEGEEGDAGNEEEAIELCHFAEDVNLWSEGEHGQTVGKFHYWIAKVDGADAFEDGDEATEYATLKELLDDLRSNGGDEQWRGDWYPITLVRDSYFQDYAQELAEDCCPYPRNSPEMKALEQWPYRCIDWEQAARELRMDYSSVEYDDVTYWYR